MTWTAYRRARGAITSTLKGSSIFSFLSFSYVVVRRIDVLCIVCDRARANYTRKIDRRDETLDKQPGRSRKTREIETNLRLKEGIGFLAGDVTRWTLRDVEVSNRALVHQRSRSDFD